MTFVADVYIGCPHGCAYCYAPSSRKVTPLKARNDFMQPKTRLTKRHLERIDRQIQGADPFEPFESFSTKQKDEETRIRDALKHRFPVRIGSVSDPFQEELEKSNRHTERILNWLGKFSYPFLLCTKSKLVADPPYLRLIKDAEGGVQISLISLNKELLRMLEPNPSDVEERIGALSKLTSCGIWTACRIQPLIPGVTEQGMPELIDKLASLGVKHVTIEFMKFPQTHVNYMNKSLQSILEEHHRNGGIVSEKLVSLGYSLKDYYRSFSDSVFRDQYFFFSKSEMNRLMVHYARMVREANSRHGSNMTFASGDEETMYLNSMINCCGVDSIWGEKGYSTCTVQKTLQMARQKTRVTWEDMSGFYNPYKEEFRKLWNQSEKGGTFFEKHVLNLSAKKESMLEDISYEYREGET